MARRLLSTGRKGKVEMNISGNDMKHIWWDWFLANKKYWHHGLTYARLNRAQTHIWLDTEIWYDLLNRHGMIDKFPWKAEIEDKENYDHAIGNFAGNISARILRFSGGM
jgi:hypothetical protein